MSDKKFQFIILIKRKGIPVKNTSFEADNAKQICDGLRTIIELIESDPESIERSSDERSE